MKVKERRYRLRYYLAGALPARLGDEMSGQAVLLFGMAATGSAAIGSSILAGLTLSAAVGGPLLGTLLDRSPHPGRTLGITLGLYAIGLATIALLLGHVWSWWIIAIALIAGFAMPSISGGWSSRLRTFTADQHIARASAIDATTFNIAGLAGPALAGLAAAWLGAAWMMAILLALLVAAIPMAWRLPRHQPLSSRNSFLRDAAAGFKVIVTKPKLRRITIVSVISYAGIGMLWVLYPLIGDKLLGNTGYGGVLASVLSASALVATIAYAKWPTRYSPDTIAFISTLILAVAMISFAFADNIATVLLAMIVAGLADGPQLAAIFAVRHREAPKHMRSQVFTTGASLKITGAACGAALAGVLIRWSPPLSILCASLVQLLAAGAYLAVPVGGKPSPE